MLCVCTIQQNQISQRTRQDLEAEIRGITRRALGDYAASVQFVWTEVAPGSGYTAGKPSTSSVVGMIVPRGTQQETREPLLRAVCNGWSRIASCSIDEIVVSAIDEGATH
jgi:hypothetical protein